MKNGIILSLIIFLVVLLIIGCSIKIRHFPEGANDKTCSIDSDCVISVATESKDNCCFECDVESINTNAERIRDEWSNKNCGNWQDECPIYDCRSLKNPKAVCISNICQIEWVERISNDAYSVEEFNSIQKEYQKVYSVVGYISELDTKCYCPKDVACSICPTMPYLILTDYQVELHGGLKYTIKDLTEQEMYILLMDVEDISRLELDGKYNMKVRFVEDDRIYLVSYERI